MGYGYYTVVGWGPLGTPERPAGYLVLATCDARGCDVEIDRGLGYLCGDSPHGPFDDAPGCGRYYCGAHSGFVGERGGCQHRGRLAWGRVLSDLVPNADGSVVCCDPIGHDGPHAWDAR
jgi:hypothetical protein